MSRILWSVVVIASATAAFADDKKLIDIPVSKLGNQYRLVGKLGEPLGTVLTLQGVVNDGPHKGPESGPNIYIRRINGRSTQEYIRVPVHPYFRLRFGETDLPGKSLPKLELGDTYEFEGFESGRFVGVPWDAYERGEED
jgi:hypothetical protein